MNRQFHMLDYLQGRLASEGNGGLAFVRLLAFV